MIWKTKEIPKEYTKNILYLINLKKLNIAVSIFLILIIATGLVSAYDSDTNDDNKVNLIKLDRNNVFENGLSANFNERQVESNSISMTSNMKSEPEDIDIDFAGYSTIKENGELLWTYESNSDSPHIDAYPLDDINSDGILDFVIIDEIDYEDRVLALSGSDGSVIWSELCDGYINDVVSLNNDLNSDGIDDIVLSYLSENELGQSINVDLISGSNGNNILTNEIATYSLESDVDFWLVVIEDANGDGIEDVLLETEIEDESYNFEFITYLLSGSDASILCTIPTYAYWEFKDFTGDGLTDIVIEEYDWDSDLSDLSVIKGSNGDVVWNSSYDGMFLGIIDVDGNDVFDLLTVTSNVNLKALKGSDGSELWNISGGWDSNEDPLYSSMISDADGDGIDDFALYLANSTSYEWNIERIQFRSGSNGDLIWDWKNPIAFADTYIYNDIDGDGIEDVICTNSNEIGTNEYLFNTTIFKGKEGTEIWNWSDQYLINNNIDPAEWTLDWHESYSWSSAVSDISGDGVTDPVIEIEIREEYTNDTYGHLSSTTFLIVALDGNDGTTLWEFETGEVEEWDFLQFMLTAWFDLNKDNVNDYLFSTNNAFYAITTTDSQTPPSNNAPTATINDISPATATVGETISFTGSGEDTDGSIAAYSWISNIDGLLNTSSSFSTTDLSVGTHTITFRVQDDDGAWSETVSDTVTINENPNVAPTAIIDSILPIEASEGETVSFNGTGRDTDGTITNYNWTSDIDGLLSNSANFTTSDLSPGVHTIYFSVQDDDGAWSDVNSSTLNVIDVLAPEVQISADPVEYISIYNPVTISMNSTDVHLASTNLIIADAEGLEIVNLSIDKDEPTTSTFEYVWNATGLDGYSVPGGTYFVYVNSSDTYGNFASANISIVVDNEKPEVIFTEIDGFTSDSNHVYASSVLLINTSASGTPGETYSVEYTLDSISASYKKSTNAELIDGNWTASFDLSLISDDGEYELTATAIDAAWNSNSTVYDKLIIVDHTSPVFSVEVSGYNETHGKLSVISSESIRGNPEVEINSEEIGVDQNIGNWTGYFNLESGPRFNVTVNGTDLAGNSNSGNSTAFIETIEFVNGSGKFNSSEFGTTITFNAVNDTSGSIIVTESEEIIANMTDDSIGLYFIDVELDNNLKENLSNATIIIPVNSVTMPGWISKEDVSISYYNETSGLWEICPTSVDMIDEVECWITYVEHFSTYGVVVTDTIAPVIDDVTPVDGTKFDEDTTSVNIQFNYSDEQTGINVSSIVFEFDGTEITDETLEITGNYASYNVTELSSGSHTASVTVVDNAGNSAVFSTSFSIDSSTTTKPKSGGGSSSSGGGSVSSAEAFGNIMFKDVKAENIVGGARISYVFNKEQNAVQYINFSALRNYGKVSATIEMLKDRSSIVEESAPGLVYRNLNIWVGNSGFATDDNIADPVIGFCVAKEWLSENDIEESSIALYRYNEGKWNSLKTSKVGQDASYIYFEAETPGFSPFAIVADVDNGSSMSNADAADDTYDTDNAGSEEETPSNEQNGIPGISIVTAVFILAFACTFRKKKN